MWAISLELRIIHLRQSESNELFSSLRFMSNKANTLQVGEKIAREEGRMY